MRETIRNLNQQWNKKKCNKSHKEIYTENQKSKENMIKLMSNLVTTSQILTINKKKNIFKEIKRVKIKASTIAEILKIYNK